MKLYNTSFNIALIPVLHNAAAPLIRYGLSIPDTTLKLTAPTVISFNQKLLSNDYKFTIELLNKTNITPNLAVIVDSIDICGITLDRVKWSSKFYPKYPEPWVSEQSDPLPEFHSGMTHLGWNGRWHFEFSVPIFQWIHRVEKLGWLYD